MLDPAPASLPDRLRNQARRLQGANFQSLVNHEKAAKKAETTKATRPRKPKRRKARSRKAAPKAEAGKVKPKVKEVKGEIDSKDKYTTVAVPALQKEFGYKNPHQIPRIEKVVVSAGVGRAASAIRSTWTTSLDTIAKVTGQHPVTTKAKKSIAAFKVREGNKVGTTVTLRGTSRRGIPGPASRCRSAACSRFPRHLRNRF